MSSEFQTILDVDNEASLESLQEAYVRAAPQHGDRARVAWKVLSDPYFSAMYHAYPDEAMLEAAGFFDDQVTPGTHAHHLDTNWMTTPLHKLQSKYQGAVLVAMGGFSPVHSGHIEMMERARAHLESRGVTVAGGYLSPSHDDYVSTKYEHALDISKRLDLAQHMVQDSDWLMVDPWEGRYTAAAINYTDVLLRLQAYLDRHTPGLEVYCVFGADNAGFARAFINYGHAVCLPRTGYEHPMAEIAHELSHCSNIYFVHELAEHSHVSSRDIRSQAAQAKNADPAPPCSGIYAIREDLDRATEQWDFQTKVLEKFTDRLIDLLQEGCGRPEIEFRRISIERQARTLKRLEAQYRVLSLDGYLDARNRLEVCRVFPISEGQIAPLGITHRVGAAPLDDQSRSLDAGDYVFVDDDIASGETIDLVTRKLTHIRFTDHISLLQHELDRPLFDVVDARDFLLGTRQGGLTVELPTGEIGRTPYMLPYVSLVHRAKLQGENEIAISCKLWQLNADTFASTDLRVQDVNPAARTVLSYLGFTDDERLDSVCRWHVQQIQQLPFAQINDSG